MAKIINSSTRSKTEAVKKAVPPPILRGVSLPELVEKVIALRVDVDNLQQEVDVVEEEVAELEEGSEPSEGEAGVPSVRVGTTTILPAHSRTGNAMTASANGALAAQDGITLVAGDYLLVKNEGAGTHLENGVYVVTSLGSAGTPWILTRAAWMDASSEVTKGAVVQVVYGTVNGQSFFVLKTADPIVINTTPLQFTFGWGYT